MNDTPKSASTAPRSALVLLRLLDLALAVSLLLLVLAWFYDPLAFPLPGGGRFSAHWGRPLVAVLAFWAARTAVKASLRRRAPAVRGLAETTAYRNACLAVLPTFVLFVLIEGALALCGVHVPSDTAPIIVTGKDANQAIPESGGVLRDPELLFAFKPGVMWDRFPINSHGFRTHEFAVPKPDGLLRVVSLGDSCTAQGHPPYSERLDECLKADPPGGRDWEAVNLGVFGYSSAQGLAVYRRWAGRLGANVVTLYFGWNDHWTEHSVTDRQRMASRMGPFAAKNLEALRKKRIYKVLSRAVGRMREGTEGRSSADARVPRVPPVEYTGTLKQIIALVRANGGVPLVLTAPRRALTETLVKSGHARSPEEAEALHDRYVELTRQVAAEENAELLDLAAIIADPAYDDGYFMEDGIHWTDGKGIPLLASLLCDKIRSMADEGKIPGF
jgi:lysophospholipase L1-like esterase